VTISSPFPDVAIPHASLYEFIFGSLTDDELGTTAVVDGPTGDSLSYAGLRQRVNAFAGALAARGIGVGDVVALQAPNIPAFVWAFHGILRAGATATTVNSLYTPDEIAVQLRDSAAKLVITVAPLLPAAAAGAAAAGIGRDQIIVLDGAEGLHQRGGAAVLGFPGA